MKFVEIIKVLVLSVTSSASAQSLRGSLETQEFFGQGRQARKVDNVPGLNLADFVKNKGHACRTSSLGTGVPGQDYTQKTVTSDWWCHFKCSKDEKCQGYEFDSDTLKCELWWKRPAAVDVSSPWVTCAVKKEDPSSDASLQQTLQPTTTMPTTQPTLAPTLPPSTPPTLGLTLQPTRTLTQEAATEGTVAPSSVPSSSPSSSSSNAPSVSPTASPSSPPSNSPTRNPTDSPTAAPSHSPSGSPSSSPTAEPSASPTVVPTSGPTRSPTIPPTLAPTVAPTSLPTSKPTNSPTTRAPTETPTTSPTGEPTSVPTASPSASPTETPRLEKYGWTNYQNGFDEELSASFNQQNGQRAAICGISSYHANRQEDRRFRFKYCAPEIATTATFTGESVYSWWDDAYRVDCPDDSFISGIYSYHSNGREDRRTKFECHSFAGYSYPSASASASSNVSSCLWTDYVNDFDEAFDYECGDQYVLSGLQTYHSNWHEDRRFRFKCCRLAKV